MNILLTQYDGAILGPIAKLLGLIMNGIYILVDQVFDVQNIGLIIILFTIVIYTLMLPLTYKQQKFSKLNQKMAPELNAIRKKYEGKKDTASMQLMQDETKLIYEKYGVSPAGSCLQMLIQMPILFALYRVFMNVPAYIGSVKGVFTGLVDQIYTMPNYADKIQAFVKDNGIRVPNVDFAADSADTIKNYLIDVLYSLNPSQWDKFGDTFSGIESTIESTHANLSHINTFMGMSIASSPWNIITSGLNEKAYVMVLLAVAIPVASYLTQRLNLKMMPTPDSGNDAAANQMKTMNVMMPLISFFMCFTVPVGLGIYWVFSAVVRTVQQYFLNKHFDKIDLNKVIEKNREKAEKKREKRGIYAQKIMDNAKMNTRTNYNLSEELTKEEKEELVQNTIYKNAHAKSGSLASKANMVKDFNERNNK